MAESISYIKVGNQDHPIDAVTVNGLSFTSEEKTRWNNKQDALSFDSIPTENSDNLVKSGNLYTVLTTTEHVVAAALNDLNERIYEVNDSISGVYNEIDRALTSVLTYRGTIGSTGDVSVLPSYHEVGDVYVVSTAGTYAGQACEPGDYILCKTSGTAASNGDWNVINGENQVDNKGVSLGAAGTSVTIATVDGTDITVSTPASWTGVSKTGTLTGVTVNGVSASVSNGVASFSETDPVFMSSPAASITASQISDWNAKQDALTFDSVPTENSENPVTSGGVYQTIVDNEYVIATALNDLNDRMIDVEDAMNSVLVSESDPVFSASPAASITSSNISAWNAKQDALTFDSIPTENSDNLVKSGALYTVIVDNEEVTAAALNDLNTRLSQMASDVETALSDIGEAINNISDSFIFDSIPTENSDNLVKSGDLYTVITQNEFVAAAALNDLNDRLNETSTMISSINSLISGLDSRFVFDSIPTENSDNLVKSGDLYDVIVSNERVVATAFNDINDRLMVVENNLNGSITSLSFNGTAVSISDGHANISVSIPAAVTSTTVAGWGFLTSESEPVFTSSPAASITAAQISAWDAGTGGGGGGGGITSESDPVFSSSVAASITTTDINKWNSNTRIFKGTCATAAGTTTKVVVCEDFTSADLVKGALIFVTFSNTNSGAVASLNLNVNSTGAKPIKKIKNAAISTLSATGELIANATYLFAYDGSNWVCITLDYNTTYTAMTAASASAGTGTTNSTITPSILKGAIQYWDAITSIAVNGTVQTVTSKRVDISAITEVNFNGASASVSNGVASILVSIPTEVTESTVSGWGFTKNTGTITGISMNGTSKGTSGNVDLGNVVTAVSFNGTLKNPSSGVVTITESDPVFAASAAASITAADISNWNNKQSGGWYVQIGSGGNLLDGTPIDIYGGGCLHMSNGTNLIIDDNNNSGSVVLYNTMDWSGIVRTSVSSSASIYNASDIRTLQDDLDLIWNKVPSVADSGDMGKILVATYDSVNGYHWVKTDTMTFGNSLKFPGSVGTVGIGNGIVTNSSMSNWGWISTGSGSAYKTLQSDFDATVHKTGVETISGNKTFLGIQTFDDCNVHLDSGSDLGNLTYTDFSWLYTSNGSGGYKTLQSELNAIRQLPAVTSSDNGKILQVSNGAWTLVTPVSIYNGSASPDNNQGNNGDLYIQTS